MSDLRAIFDDQFGAAGARIDDGYAPVKLHVIAYPDAWIPDDSRKERQMEALACMLAARAK